MSPCPQDPQFYPVTTLQRQPSRAVKGSMKVPEWGQNPMGLYHTPQIIYDTLSVTAKIPRSIIKGMAVGLPLLNTFPVTQSKLFVSYPPEINPS